MPKKSLLVTTSTFPRWLHDTEPSFVYELCRQLTGSFHITVLAPHAPGARREERLEGIEVIRYRYFFSRLESLCYEGGILARLRANPLRLLLTPLLLAAQFWALRALLKRQRFDLLHAHWLFPQGWLAQWLCRSEAAPALLCTAHGSDLHALSGPLFRLFRQQVIRHAGAISVVSQPMREALLQQGADPARLHVLPMGIDLRDTFIPAHRTTHDRHQTLLFVGRLVESKGVAMLLQALAIVIKQAPATRLLIVGDGPERETLQHMAQRLGLNQQVEFAGAITHAALAGLYQRAAIFVSASRAEGFGLVFVEALGCGCAVIAPDLPEVKDIIQEGITGLIIDPRNPVDIASKILQLLGDGALRQQLAAAGRAQVLHEFDWQVCARRYRDLLENLSTDGTQPGC